MSTLMLEAPADRLDLPSLKYFLLAKGLVREPISETPPWRLANEGSAVQLDLRNMAPVLILADGECIDEAIAICSYLELIKPGPTLMGRTSVEKAHVLTWIQRLASLGCSYWTEAVRHSAQFDVSQEIQHIHYNLPRHCIYPERFRVKAELEVRNTDRWLRGSGGLVGDCFTLADIYLLVFVEFLISDICVQIPDDCCALINFLAHAKKIMHLSV